MTATVEVVSKMKTPRLYIALYRLNGALRENDPSDAHDYHWAFIMAPKEGPQNQQCLRYRIRKTGGSQTTNPGKVEFDTSEWEVDKTPVRLGRHDDIIARVLVAKVQAREAVDEDIMLAWPKKTVHVKDSGRHRTSKDWVERVFDGMNGLSCPDSGWLKVVLSGKDWAAVESCCTEFAVRVEVEGASGDSVPTFDMLKDRETSALRIVRRDSYLVSST